MLRNPIRWVHSRRATHHPSCYMHPHYITFAGYIHKYYTTHYATVQSPRKSNVSGTSLERPDENCSQGRAHPPLYEFVHLGLGPSSSSRAQRGQVRRDCDNFPAFQSRFYPTFLRVLVLLWSMRFSPIGLRCVNDFPYGALSYGTLLPFFPFVRLFSRPLLPSEIVNCDGPRGDSFW